MGSVGMRGSGYRILALFHSFTRSLSHHHIPSSSYCSCSSSPSPPPPSSPPLLSPSEQVIHCVASECGLWPLLSFHFPALSLSLLLLYCFNAFLIAPLCLFCSH